MEIEDNELQFIIIDDVFQKYELIFFQRFEKSGINYLDFLENEKSYIENILNKIIFEQGQLHQEYLDDSGHTELFYKYCGNKVFLILEEYKNTILKQKNIDPETLFNISTDILEKYDLCSLFDETEEYHKRADFLIEYLNSFTNTFFFPEYDCQKNSIYKFIKNEINKEKFNLLRFTNNAKSMDFILPELDYSGNNELKPKQKLILLNELGIVEYLNNKLQIKDNASHLAEIITTITGIKGTPTLTGYCNYLIRRDDENKNSPYNSEQTVSETLQIYSRFKIKNE